MHFDGNTYGDWIERSAVEARLALFVANLRDGLATGNSETLAAIIAREERHFVPDLYGEPRNRAKTGTSP